MNQISTYYYSVRMRNKENEENEQALSKEDMPSQHGRTASCWVRLTWMSLQQKKHMSNDDLIIGFIFEA